MKFTADDRSNVLRHLTEIQRELQPYGLAPSDWLVDPEWDAWSEIAGMEEDERVALTYNTGWIVGFARAWALSPLEFCEWAEIDPDQAEATYAALEAPFT